MEMNNELLKQSQQLSQADGAAFSRKLKAKTQELAEISIGRGVTDESINLLLSLERDYTVTDAWFGTNIQTARKDEKTFEVIKHLFKLVLLEMNCNHPWTNKLIGDKMVQRLMDFDATWTLEDFGLFFEMAADGKLKQHYGKPSRDWWHQCQVAYNELKFEAREQIAARAKAKAEAERLTANDPQWSGHVSQRPRTMAEFLGGKNHLSAADRAELAQRDKQRRQEKQ